MKYDVNEEGFYGNYGGSIYTGDIIQNGGGFEECLPADT